MAAAQSVPMYGIWYLEQDGTWQIAVQIEMDGPILEINVAESRNTAEALFTVAWDAVLESQATVSGAKAKTPANKLDFWCPRSLPGSVWQFGTSETPPK
jgi:hypothetical protein